MLHCITYFVNWAINCSHFGKLKFELDRIDWIQLTLNISCRTTLIEIEEKNNCIYVHIWSRWKKSRLSPEVSILAHSAYLYNYNIGVPSIRECLQHTRGRKYAVEISDSELGCIVESDELNFHFYRSKINFSTWTTALGNCHLNE